MECRQVEGLVEKDAYLTQAHGASLYREAFKGHSRNPGCCVKHAERQTGYLPKKGFELQ